MLKFNYKMSVVESNFKKKADYLNYKMKEFFKNDSFTITAVNISFTNDYYNDNVMCVEYVTANLLHWVYRTYYSECEKRHILVCKENPKYNHDWWT